MVITVRIALYSNFLDLFLSLLLRRQVITDWWLIAHHINRIISRCCLNIQLLSHYYGSRKGALYFISVSIYFPIILHQKSIEFPYQQSMNQLVTCTFILISRSLHLNKSQSVAICHNIITPLRALHGASQVSTRNLMAAPTSLAASAKAESTLLVNQKTSCTINLPFMLVVLLLKSAIVRTTIVFVFMIPKIKWIFSHAINCLCFYIFIVTFEAWSQANAREAHFNHPKPNRQI